MGYRTRTRPGRLALLDEVLWQLEAPLLTCTAGPHGQAPVVDLGIGAHPWTTLELAARLAPVPVIGVDRVEALVARARALNVPGVSFICGSFSLPVRNARLIRVMNVLRDGPAKGVADAHERLGASLAQGGLLIEGSCAPEGEVGTAHWIRKTEAGLVREGLVLWLTGARGLHPMAFRERLPRDLAGDPSHRVHATLDRWTVVLQQLPPSSDRLVVAAGMVEALSPVPVRGGLAFKLVWSAD